MKLSVLLHKISEKNQENSIGAASLRKRASPKMLEEPQDVIKLPQSTSSSKSRPLRTCRAHSRGICENLAEVADLSMTLQMYQAPIIMIQVDKEVYEYQNIGISPKSSQPQGELFPS